MDLLVRVRVHRLYVAIPSACHPRHGALAGRPWNLGRICLPWVSLACNPRRERARSFDIRGSVVQCETAPVWLPPRSFPRPVRPSVVTSRLHVSSPKPWHPVRVPRYHRSPPSGIASNVLLLTSSDIAILRTIACFSTRQHIRRLIL